MKKIGLDAGHGLNTAGKQTPTGIKEWTLNDKVRDKVVEFLADYDCEFVHVDNNEGSVDESLASRVEKYLSAGVDVFVSLHHNAWKGIWNEATGVEVWVDTNATAEDLKLAVCINSRLSKYTGLKGRGIWREDWWVINQNKIPAVLIEGGFMDSSNDYKIITSDAGQTAYAKAVAEGLIEYLDLKKKANKEDKPMVYKINIEDLKKQGYTSVSFELGATTENVVTPPVTPKPTIEEGSKVKIKPGAKSYDGVAMADFVYNKVYTIDELKGARAVLDKNGLHTAFHIDNLILV